MMSESEKKRLLSLKLKRQTFKVQNKTIQNGLQCVNNSISNKKIVFNDDIDIQNSEENIEKSSNRQNTLFNSDDEDQEQFQWNEDELDAKAKLNKSLFKLQTSIGNDERFVLDDRFIDNDNKVDKIKNENEDDQNNLDEKKWQLNILENLLGKPVKTQNNIDTDKKEHRMIRYDPSASNHKHYEVIVEKLKVDKPNKKKQKKNDIDIKNDEPISTNNEIFYDVSENLVDSLKQNEQFSLLKHFGSNNTNIDNIKNHADNEDEENKSFQINFNVKKFKYDSSDSENDKEINEKNILLPKTEQPIKFNQNDDRLFFYNNDPRFDEAKDFFKNQLMHEEHIFKNRRRELKEIVHSKIRKNLKKSNPWNKKRISKVQKK